MTIEEHLGAARPLIDAWVDRFPEGEVVARSGAHRMDCAANWKLVTDNSTDGYHPAFSHRSLLQMAQRLGESKDMAYFAESPDEGAMYCRYLGNGHSFIDQRPMYEAAGDYWAQQRPAPGREALEAKIRERYDPAEATRLLDLSVGSQMNLTIFPNLLIIGNQIQSLQPIAVDRTLLVWQATTSPHLPDEINALRMRSQEDFPSFGEPDDLANFAECQRGLSIPEVEWVLMNRGYGIEGRQTLDPDGGVTAPATDDADARLHASLEAAHAGRGCLRPPIPPASRPTSTWTSTRHSPRTSPSSTSPPPRRGPRCARPPRRSCTARRGSTRGASRTGWSCSCRSASTGCR